MWTGSSGGGVMVCEHAYVHIYIYMHAYIHTRSTPHDPAPLQTTERKTVKYSVVSITPTFVYLLGKGST